MIQCLKHKAKERPEKRRGNKVNELRPPHLEQPGQMNTIALKNQLIFLFSLRCTFFLLLSVLTNYFLSTFFSQVSVLCWSFF